MNDTPTPRGSLFDDRLFVNANTPTWMKWFLEVYDERYLLCNPKQCIYCRMPYAFCLYWAYNRFHFHFISLHYITLHYFRSHSHPMTLSVPSLYLIFVYGYNITKKSKLVCCICIGLKSDSAVRT